MAPDDQERAALRASLGFTDSQPPDTFTDLGRPRGGDDTAEEPSAAVPDGFAQVEAQIAELTAVVSALSDLAEQRITDDSVTEIRDQLQELAVTQQFIINWLNQTTAEIRQATQATLNHLNIHQHGSPSSRRPRDLLRRQTSAP